MIQTQTRASRPHQREVQDVEVWARMVKESWKHLEQPYMPVILSQRRQKIWSERGALVQVWGTISCIVSHSTSTQVPVLIVLLRCQPHHLYPSKMTILIKPNTWKPHWRTGNVNDKVTSPSYYLVPLSDDIHHLAVAVQPHGGANLSKRPSEFLWTPKAQPGSKISIPVSTSRIRQQRHRNIETRRQSLVQ